MDYKELIETLRLNAKYPQSCFGAWDINANVAADAIETLLADWDAAVKDLHAVADCTSCKFYEIGHLGCDTCGAFLENWQWRGPQKHD